MHGIEIPLKILNVGKILFSPSQKNTKKGQECKGLYHFDTGLLSH
jgi:hypothetical protein